MRLARTLVAGLVAAAMLVVSAGPAAAKGPVNPEVAQAKRLAASVANARTPAARVRALTSVMRAVRIGVTTQSGRPIVAPPERGSAARAHLYDFELKGLAGALGRGSTKSFADVARVLGTGGFVLAPGRALPEDLIQNSLRAAVRNGRAGARGHMLPLLVAQLGARRGQDPSGSAAPSSIRLDALQAWLISADFTIGALRRIPAKGPIRIASAGTSRARAAGLPEDCQALRKAIDEANEKAGEAGKVAKEAAGKVADQAANEVRRNVNKYAVKVVPGWAVRGAWRVGARVKAAADLMPILHGSLLAYSVEVSAPASVGPVHWGHGGPGGMLAFEVTVTMLDDYGDLLVKCGALAGLELPPHGAIPGVTVKWQEAEGDIKQEGSLDCPSTVGALADKVLIALTGQTVCTTKTDEKGIARVRLQTNSEATPAVGLEAESSGVLDGVALYQTAAGGGPTGFIGQFLFPKTGGGTHWTVRSHPCGGVVPANATAVSAAFTGAHASAFTPIACGAIYARVSAKVSTTVTRPGCPAHTSTSAISGATNALPPEALNLDTTAGTGTATGVDINIISPFDAPTDPCEKYSYPFTVPFYFEVSRTGDDQMTLTWGPTAEALAPDPVAPQVAASLSNAAWGGHFPPRNGTYEVDRPALGASGNQHWSITIEYSSAPFPSPSAVPVPSS